ncbi:MAG: hypothetical protein LIP06_10570 [Tannerellaceae bacterium]|nr:hypothetical protein [Tannerellaceae bacterium]
MEFGEIDMISAIRIENRVFYISNKKEVIEVLQFTPAIWVYYYGKIKDQGKNAGYGGKTHTAAVDSYSKLESGGLTHFLPGERKKLDGIKVVYEIEVGKKKKKFMNFTKLTNIFKNHKAHLKDYIDKSAIDFNDTQQIVELCNYAFSLE